MSRLWHNKKTEQLAVVGRAVEDVVTTPVAQPHRSIAGTLIETKEDVSTSDTPSYAFKARGDYFSMSSNSTSKMRVEKGLMVPASRLP